MDQRQTPIMVTTPKGNEVTVEVAEPGELRPYWVAVEQGGRWVNYYLGRLDPHDGDPVGVKAYALAIAAGY